MYGNRLFEPKDIPTELRDCFEEVETQCGAPWERVVEKVPTGAKHKLPSGMATYEGGHTSVHRNGRELEPTYNEVTKPRTLGWQPTCKCGTTDTVPCTVLDPFIGSATTGLVARANGCRCIGIELNPEYIEIAAKRLRQDVIHFEPVRESSI